VISMKRSGLISATGPSHHFAKHFGRVGAVTDITGSQRSPILDRFVAKGIPKRSDCPIQAFSRLHLWIFLHAGHCIENLKVSVCKMISLVVIPVGTAFRKIGHSIMMSDIAPPGRPHYFIMQTPLFYYNVLPSSHVQY
jgi:hypothetical protein